MTVAIIAIVQIATVTVMFVTFSVSIYLINLNATFGFNRKLRKTSLHKLVTLKVDFADLL